jgi:hypothetical protein
LKFGIYVHPKRPKVSVEQLISRIRSTNLQYSPNEPDIAIVVGGDGTFGYFGRILAMPMLFVGVRDSNILGSKARLAEITYNILDKALHEIAAGRYEISEKRKLSVRYCGRQSDILTDVYLERGILAGCIRYGIQVTLRNTKFKDYSIGNGVIVSTSFGSGGYFSYPNWIKENQWDQNSSIERFSDNRIGICHIIPTYLVREKNGVLSLTNKIQYTVPIDSQIQIRLVRNANARVYGTSLSSKGNKVVLGDKITICASSHVAKIIKLKT